MPDLNQVSDDLLSAGYRPLEFLADEPLDGRGETVLIRGDVTGSGAVRGVRSLVVEGGVAGSPDTPCLLNSEGPVVIFGPVRFARIRGQAVFLGKGARQCLLTGDETVWIKGDAVDVNVCVGDSDRMDKDITEYGDSLSREGEIREELGQQIRFEKSRLNELLQATGIVFNLNIGRIVRQESGGLVVDLDPFYEAVVGRSEDEIDQALKEFFAKAILGLLTRMNRRYIAGGTGHRQRFAAVVRKLHDLVWLCRKFDRGTADIREREIRILDQLQKTWADPFPVCVEGAVLPGFHLVFSRLISEKFTGFAIQKTALTLRKGTREDKDEVVLWCDEIARDLLFIPPDSLCQVGFSIENQRVIWTPLPPS